MQTCQLIIPHHYQNVPHHYHSLISDLASHIISHTSAGTPTITTVFPTFPITSSDPSTLMVPVGYRGTVVTCAAMGWPTPTIEWVRNAGQLADSGMVSESARTQNSAFVLARLRSLDGFLGSAAGNYTCAVRTNDTDAAVSSKVITLLLHTEIPLTLTQMICSVSSLEKNFQVRVLYTDCLTWGEDLKVEIAKSFLRNMVNIVGATCQNCAITPQDITIESPPTCSQQVERATLFRGRVSTRNVSRTDDIFCALNRWQQSGPLIYINSNVHLVDRRCALDRSLDAMECASGLNRSGSRSFPTITVIVAADSVVLFLLLLIVVITVLWRCFRSRKRVDQDKGNLAIGEELENGACSNIIGIGRGGGGIAPHFLDGIVLNFNVTVSKILDGNIGTVMSPYHTLT